MSTDEITSSKDFFSLAVLSMAASGGRNGGAGKSVSAEEEAIEAAVIFSRTSKGKIPPQPVSDDIAEENNVYANIAGNGSIKNADNAVIDPKKLISYVLNDDHPVGGNKARVFESALGYNKSNANDLIAQIKQGVTKNPAIPGAVDQYGQRFTVDMPITGANGKTVMVRTGWILDNGSTTPRLTTAYVK